MPKCLSEASSSLLPLLSFPKPEGVTDKLNDVGLMRQTVKQGNRQTFIASNQQT